MLRRVFSLVALIAILSPAAAKACVPNAGLEIENALATPQVVTVTGPCQIAVTLTVSSQTVSSIAVPAGSYTVSSDSGERPIDIAKSQTVRVVLE